MGRWPTSSKSSPKSLPNPGWIVRKGTSEDGAAIAELIERVDRARFDRSEAEWAAVRERLRTVLESEAVVTFVAEQDGRVVGELLGVPRVSGALGIGVAVEDGSRRQGCASALFEAVLAWAPAHGFTELELDVQEANEPARALYEKLGFVDTGRRRQGERGPVLTLTKSL